MKCPICGYEKTETKELNDVIFGEWVYNSETKQDERVAKNYDIKETREHLHDYAELTKYDDNYEYYKCVCGSIKLQKHNLDRGKVLANGDTLYSCLNEGCDYTKTEEKQVEPDIPVIPAHRHHFDTIIRFDDNYEYRSCKCGEEIKTAHSLKTTVNSDGSKDITCENNCGYTKHIAAPQPEHKHTEATRKEYTQNKDDICYVEITYCTECSKELGRKEIGHNYQSSINPDDYSTHYSCQNDGCNVSYDVEHVHNSNGTRKEVLNTDDDCYQIVTYCDVCNAVQNTEKFSHNSDGIEKEYTHDASQACYNESIYCTECNRTIDTRSDGHIFGQESVEFLKTDPSICYIAKSTCTECNIERTRNVQHKFNETEFPGIGALYECEREDCGYAYEVYFDEESTINLNEEEVINFQDKQFILKRTKKNDKSKGLK